MKKISLLIFFLFFTISIYSADLIILTQDGTEKKQSFDENITEMTISNVKVKSINGFENFESLKKILFHHVDFSKADMSFVFQFYNQISLEFYFTTLPNLEFLNTNSKIIAVDIQESTIKNNKNIDLEKSQIEYFSCGEVFIEKFPNDIKFSSVLKYFILYNLYYDSINTNWITVFENTNIKYFLPTDFNWELKQKGYLDSILDLEDLNTIYTLYF